MCIRQTVFIFSGVFYFEIEGLEMRSALSPLLCDIFQDNFEEKSSTVNINFLIGLCMWMILSFLFHLILIFLVCYFRLIQLIVVFNSLAKLKATTLFIFLICWFPRTLTGSQRLSLEKSFLISLSPHALSNYPSPQNVAVFYT